jgi:hypothetical protein
MYVFVMYDVYFYARLFYEKLPKCLNILNLFKITENRASFFRITNYVPLRMTL